MLIELVLPEGRGLLKPAQLEASIMANDWIKITHDLESNPKVTAIMRRLGLTKRRDVLGSLLRVWLLADRHAVFVGSDAARSALGHCPEFLDICPKLPDTSSVLCPGSSDDIDDAAEQTGFAEAMQAVGWLVIHPFAVEFPDWDVQNSSSAKTRASDQKRKQRERAEAKNAVRRPISSLSESFGHLSEKSGQHSGTLSGETRTLSGEDRTMSEKTRTREEKRREYNTPQPPKGDDEISPDGEEEQSATPGQTLEEIREMKPIAPTPRRETASDHPELVPIAKRVADYFDAKVKPAQPARNYTASVVVARLLDGLTEADLKRIIDAYARRCEEGEVPRRSRRACHTFFAKDTGSYLDFLNAKPVQNGGGYVPPREPDYV